MSSHHRGALLTTESNTAQCWFTGWCETAVKLLMSVCSWSRYQIQNIELCAVCIWLHDSNLNESDLRVGNVSVCVCLRFTDFSYRWQTDLYSLFCLVCWQCCHLWLSHQWCPHNYIIMQFSTNLTENRKQNLLTWFLPFVVLLRAYCIRCHDIRPINDPEGQVDSLY